MKTIAIVSAVPEEMFYYRSVLGNQESKYIDGVEYTTGDIHGKQVVLLATGFGMASASMMATHLYTRFQPEAILFSGTSGGIDPELTVGDVVIGTDAFEAEIQGVFTSWPGTSFEPALISPINHKRLPELFPADPALLKLSKTVSSQDFKIKHGTIVASTSFPSPPWLFEAIKAKNALVIDMETPAWYQLGWIFKVPVIAIRGVSNILNKDGADDSNYKTDVDLASLNSAKVLLDVLDRMSSRYIIKAQ